MGNIITDDGWREDSTLISYSKLDVFLESQQQQERDIINRTYSKYSKNLVHIKQKPVMISLYEKRRRRERASRSMRRLIKRNNKMQKRHAEDSSKNSSIMMGDKREGLHLSQSTEE